MLKTTKVLNEGAQALQEAASSHKRAAAYHKRRARETTAKLADLVEQAARLGIQIVIQPQGEGRENFHGQQKRPGHYHPTKRA